MQLTDSIPTKSFSNRNSRKNIINIKWKYNTNFDLDKREVLSRLKLLAKTAPLEARLISSTVNSQSAMKTILFQKQLTSTRMVSSEP